MTILPRAVIFGCSGPHLTQEEQQFFQRVQPLGFILFERNCETPQQIQKLVSDLRSCVQHAHVPILIDHEGGRVTRLKIPYWRKYPPANTWGHIADQDLERAQKCVSSLGYIMGCDLAELGITVNCAPILDVPMPEAHPIIGDRAFHDSPETCAILAHAYLQGMARAGIIGVIKHLPGHGRALSDSHLALPVVHASFDELNATDFQSFRTLCEHLYRRESYSPWGMTAHICYTALDETHLATQSHTIITSTIRQTIGFRGFLVSDCLTMNALAGDYERRAARSLAAGCDAVLHCNGKLEEMILVACGTTPLTENAWERLSASTLTSAPTDTSHTQLLLQELNQALVDGGFPDEGLLMLDTHEDFPGH